MGRGALWGSLVLKSCIQPGRDSKHVFFFNNHDFNFFFLVPDIISLDFQLLSHLESLD